MIPTPRNTPSGEATRWIAPAKDVEMHSAAFHRTLEWDVGIRGGLRNGPTSLPLTAREYL